MHEANAAASGTIPGGVKLGLPSGTTHRGAKRERIYFWHSGKPPSAAGIVLLAPKARSNTIPAFWPNP
jgi:hypothetical protein